MCVPLKTKSICQISQVSFVSFFFFFCITNKLIGGLLFTGVCVKCSLTETPSEPSWRSKKKKKKKTSLMWFSEWIKRSSLKIICCNSKFVWHKSTAMLNLLLCCPSTHWLLVSCPGPWHAPSVSDSNFSALPPFCSDYELRCKTQSQHSKQNKPSAVFAFALTPPFPPLPPKKTPRKVKKNPSSLIFNLPPAEKIYCLQGINNRSTTPHISIYV